MTVSLQVLREQEEANRFARQRQDDARTAIPRNAREALARALKKAIAGEVRFDNGSRALYATDGSNYRQVPIGVVIPRSLDDVQAAIDLCRQYGAPVLNRGGGTSLAGQCCNVAVVLDFTKYLHHVLEIDPQRRTARVEPGCVLDDLRAAARRQGLTFGPDPATHNHCALGGMLGNNSCGVHSLLCRNAGLGLRTSDNTHALDVLTYEGLRLRVGPTSEELLMHLIAEGGRRGEIYRGLKAIRDTYADEIRRRFPRLDRRVSGYNLDELLPENGFHVARALVGTESTCVTILEATLQLVPEPSARSLLVLGYPDVFQAADHVLEILPFNPTGMEGIDELLFEWVKKKGDYRANLKLLPPGHGWLLAEFGGATKQESDAAARRCMEALRRSTHPPAMKLFDDPEQEESIWKVRESSLGSTAWVPGNPDTWEGWEDSAVPVEKTGEYLRQLKKLLDKYNYDTSLYGHLGQGCIHCRIPFDLYTAEGVRHFRSFLEEASDLVLRLGGSLSGEHGDGQSRAELLPKMYGPTIMQAFGQFKQIWDPAGRMNPGKVVEAYHITDNLRLGPDYNPPEPQTFFTYPDDKNSFARAALRCVGIGECRREGGQVMCPSYMATREEMHSTRGRARLLWEMLEGEVLTAGWDSQAVYDSLALCLSCKGCKGDCPVNVDMATYKAEFLAHHFAHRRRPRHMFLFGFIHVFSRLGGLAPGLANLLTQTPGLSYLARVLAGMDQRRRIPALAAEPFVRWYQRRAATQPVRHPTGAPVLLFPDTFHNYYNTGPAKAAVAVLEDAGFRVIVPAMDLCCGRPLYDYGYLKAAKLWLEDLLGKLRPYIQADIPMVVLEPSCWSVFYDEAANLLATSHDAQRLRTHTYLLAEFLKKRAPHYQPPPLAGTALLHRHCHQKSERKHEPNADKDILQAMGLEVREPESGCCGMAGAFGYTAGDPTDVSLACGQRVLIPEVYRAAPADLIVADGFSCQEQIHQMSTRRGLHVAEVLALARQTAGHVPPHPEQIFTRPEVAARRRGMLRAAAGLALAAAAGYGLWRATKSPRRIAEC